MEELALKVEHVSKEYRLGMIGGATLKAELQSKWAKLRHKEDPNLRIGERAHEKNERFLALDDISLEIKKGERVAIIGHNGAGKSTLLKLICRVTAPTKGTIFKNGRITSMLEVGTGFHQELTGEENIYLNGAILGMSKAEVAEKYEEIVDFSEVRQFIKTPVKRYSSGMRVKLGFSVASHLNSEIMIMDEVLAVGDVNFQNKCIAQMRKVADEEGRTILYVSHNMDTIRKLCDRCIVLEKGKVIFDGNVEAGIDAYLKNDKLDNTTSFDLTQRELHRKCNGRHVLQNLEILDYEKPQIEYGDAFSFRVKWLSDNDYERLKIKFIVIGIDSSPVGLVFGGDLKHKAGINSANFEFDTSCLVPGRYSVEIMLYDEDEVGNVMFYDMTDVMRFEVIHSSKSVHLRHWFKYMGNAVLDCIRSLD